MFVVCCVFSVSFYGVVVGFVAGWLIMHFTELITG